MAQNIVPKCPRHIMSHCGASLAAVLSKFPDGVVGCSRGSYEAKRHWIPVAIYCGNCKNGGCDTFCYYRICNT